MRRRSVMLDEEHARLLEELASRYGVSMASYLRGLLEAAWEAEQRGLNAAAALRRGLVFEALTRLGGLPAPRELLRRLPPGEAREAYRRLGAALRGLLGREAVYDLAAVLAERSGAGVAEYSRILILARGSAEAEALLGLAEGAGLETGVDEETGSLYIARP